jgi:hypothetical protein
MSSGSSGWYWWANPIAAVQPWVTGQLPVEAGHADEDQAEFALVEESPELLQPAGFQSVSLVLEVPDRLELLTAYVSDGGCSVLPVACVEQALTSFSAGCPDCWLCRKPRRKSTTASWTDTVTAPELPSRRHHRD